jgi:hypothetical protein
MGGDSNLPDETTDLFIASPGHCASNALASYIREFNPDLRIVLLPHIPAALIYAVNRNIPVLAITRDMFKWWESTYLATNKITTNEPDIFFRHIIHLETNL